MASNPHVTPEQLAQERSLRFALLADLGVLALFVPVGLLGGSLTIKAEAIRFVLMGLTIAEVNRRIDVLKHSMAQEIEHADISILTTDPRLSIPQ